MDSKQNISKSETSCIDLSAVKGYSLRAGAFADWMARNGYSNQDIAGVMGISAEEVVYKLLLKKEFEKEQIKRLVRFMKAKDAFFVLHFKSFEERCRVYRETFGHEMKVKKRERRRKKNE